MTLGIVGKDSLDVIETMIKSKFSTIKRSESFEQKKDSIPHDMLPYTEFLGTMTSNDIPFVKVVPLGAVNKLVMNWQLSSSYDDYQCKKEQFWSNIIGHEGQNSLLSCLKRLSFVTSLSAGSEVNQLYDLFQISMVLTEHGNENVDKIINVVFQFIDRMVKLSEREIERLYGECKRISEINFDNKSKEDPESYVLSLVDNLRQFNDIHVLSGQSHYDPFNENVLAKIKEYIHTISLIKPIIVHLNKKYDSMLNNVEQYYQTSYQIDWINNVNTFTFKQCDNMNMNSPVPNIFIPDDLSLIDMSIYENVNMPIQLHESKCGELWYYPNVQFNQPKLSVEFAIILPESLNNVNDKILCNLYVSALSEIINEHLYSATLVNNSYGIYMDNKLHISVYGYSDKLINVWLTVLKAMNEFHCDCDQQLFDRIVEMERRKYLSHRSMNTVKQAMWHVNQLFIKNTVFYQDALTFLNNITINDLKQYEKNMFANYHYIGYLCGNVSLEQCGKFHSMFQELMKSKSSHQNDNYNTEFYPFTRRLTGCLTGNNTFTYQPFNEKELDVNSSSVILFDFGNEHMNDYKNAVMSSILETIIDEVFFDELRTKQQLGYCVQCSNFTHNFMDKNKSALMFIVQSSTHPSDYLQKQINDFITQIIDFLTIESFDQTKESLITKLSEPFQRLSSMADHYFSEIQKRRFEFNAKKMKIKAAESLTHGEFIKYVNQYVVHNDKKITINVN